MPELDLLNAYQYILGSGSPRRKMLLEGLGLDFTIRTADVDEVFPEHLQAGEIARYLSKLKADALVPDLKPNELLITADTIVWMEDHVLNKPLDLAEARQMLTEISGKRHQVFTGVCLSFNNQQIRFEEATSVWFNKLTDAEIEFYLERHHPLDKAGAYGIQEFIGYIGIQKVEGDFYNVVGFPVQRFWQTLKSFGEG